MEYHRGARTNTDEPLAWAIIREENDVPSERALRYGNNPHQGEAATVDQLVSYLKSDQKWSFSTESAHSGHPPWRMAVGGSKIIRLCLGQLGGTPTRRIAIFVDS